MSRGTRFNTTQLKLAGFSQDAQGKWSKDNLQASDTKSQDSKPQPDERKAALAEKEDKGRGKESFRYCVIIHSYRTQLLDWNNMAIKQIEDCLTGQMGNKKYGIGIIPDDSPKFCDPPILLQTKVKKTEERTEIEVLRYSTTNKQL